MRWEEIAYHALIDKQIHAASLTFRQAKSEGLLDAEQIAPPYAVMARMLADAFTRGSESRYQAEAQLAGARSLLALHTYRSKFGHYPQTLMELEQGLGWVLPKDPFSDDDLVYRRQDKGFLLYSVGTDMKDDGGRQNKNERGPDIVWKSDR